MSGARLDLWFALLFGIVGYLLKKLDYPIAPMVLAMILGDKMEDAFRQSMLMAKGSMGVFYSNPLVGTITTLALLLLLWPLVSRLLRAAQSRPAGKTG